MFDLKLSFHAFQRGASFVLLLWIIYVIYVSCLSCFLVSSLQPNITCWEKANLLAVLVVMFSCVFVTFPCGALGQMWYLVVLLPDLCLLTYYNNFFTIITV